MASISLTGQRGPAIGLIALLAIVGCAPAQSSEPAAGYELTIRNTNPGQNFSPPVMILHTPEYRLFELGQPAT